VAVVGAATALFAGTIGLVQNDIKRVLAYSTVSQLGYMFLAMGVGAFGAGIFHLYTHAFFKALLFLGSGAVIHALHGEQDIRNMGGLKKFLPVTYWTFVVGSIAIAGVPPLAGFFSKDEILFETFVHGHQWLWVIGIITSLLTATYMWRLVHLTFHGPFRFSPAAAHGGGHGHGPAAHADHGHHGGAGATHAGHEPEHAHHDVHLHDAPPAMATALIVLAIGSAVAGLIGVPHALGGHNILASWLEPSFQAPAVAGDLSALTVGNCAPGTIQPAPAGATAAADSSAMSGMTVGDCSPGSDVARASLEQPAQPPASAEHAEPAAAEEDHTELELTLMGFSTLIALLGIGIATWIWLKNPAVADRMATSFPGVHRLLLNNYYVDEIYDATVVQPIKIVSEEGLWRGMDARVVDGAVNGAGQLVGGMSAVLRLLQNGSVKAYAASTFLGVVAILAYYVWR
jgi:NADH-quinone oxidoreductase subunit L